MNSCLRIRRSRLLIGFLLLLLLHGVVRAQQEPPLTSITYRLDMSRPVSHLFEVAIEVELPAGAPPQALDFQMPKWSPGRYAVFDFAKNVQEVHAASGICPRNENVNSEAPRIVCRPVPLPVSRVDDQTWRVDTKGNGRLTLTYKADV